MITAVDTCVLLDFLTGSGEHGDNSREALAKCARTGALIVCDIVFAELAAAFDGDLERTESFLDAAGIRREGFTAAALARAGGAFRAYRRAGGRRDRIIADFLIGTHAMDKADRLLTRDRGVFRSHFAELQIVEP